MWNFGRDPMVLGNLSRTGSSQRPTAGSRRYSKRPKSGANIIFQPRIDAIKETNNLGSQRFDVETTDIKGVWLAKALHPDTKKFLGYIRFLEKKGTVEVTNFDAQLSFETLNL